MRDEHEVTLATQARASNHRRHDIDDDRRTCDEYRRTQGIPRFERCVHVQRKLARRDLRLDRAYLAWLQLPLASSLGERTASTLHAEDDRNL